MTKGGTPPKTMTKRGTRIFVDGEVFDVHVVVGITPTAQRDVCASTVHCSSYIHHHCLRTAERLTACGASVQALSSLKRQTSWYPVLTGNISKKSHIVIWGVYWTEEYYCCSYSGSAENAARNALCTMSCTAVYTLLCTRCPYNEVPGGEGIIRTMIREYT